MQTPINCLSCNNEIEFNYNISVDESKALAGKNEMCYRRLFCSQKCYLNLVGHTYDKIEISELPIYQFLEIFIEQNKEFTYILLKRIEYDENVSKDTGRTAYTVDWDTLRINDKGEMIINNPLDEMIDNLDFGSARYFDFELGLWDDVKLDDLIVGWNNVQYIKAQKDKNHCDAELVKYSNSDLWKIRKKYFDNVLTTFREWFRINKHTPPDLDTYVEPKNYSGNPKSKKVIRLLELAKEMKLKTGETIPRAVKVEMAEKLKSQKFGETSLEYIRRTLTKYYYARPKTYDAEWDGLPYLLPKKQTIDSSPSDDMLD